MSPISARAVEVNMDLGKRNIGVSLDKSGRGISVGMHLPQASSTYVDDYEKLKNHPSIERVKLIGDKTFEELGLSSISADDLLEILL